MKNPEFHALILAAGKGTRMKSELPKVLHQACGRSLLGHVLQACAGAGAKSAIVIVGHGKELVTAELSTQRILPTREAWQQKQKGTGHAIQTAAKSFQPGEELFLIVNGDGPLLQAEHLRAMVEFHRAEKADLTLGVTELENPFGYGRVLEAKGRVRKIVEEKEASAKEKRIHRVNGGVYVVSRAFLDQFLPKLKASARTGEIYLTDLLALGASAKKKLLAYEFPADELLGVNDHAQLAEVSKKIRRNLLEAWMREGVSILDPDRVYAEVGVSVEAGAVIEPGTALYAGTKVGRGARIGTGAILKNARIEANAVIKAYSYLEDCLVRAGASVGPFAHLRPQAEVGEGAKVGNFVELKKTKLGKGSKVSHLSYLGDAKVGDDVNIGCGFVTCNYDGIAKHETVIGDGAFVGSDVQAVAPIVIGRGAYVASGSTITKNVPEGALAVARARQENKEGYVERLRQHQAARAKKKEG